MRSKAEVFFELYRQRQQIAAQRDELAAQAQALLEAEQENLRKQIAQYNMGLSAHAGLCERLIGQVKKLELEERELRAKTAAQLRANNRDAAGQYALRLQTIQRELGENRTQLGQAETTYKELIRARDVAIKMVPEFPAGLDKIRLADLDRIATPSALRLRVGLGLYQDDPAGQAHIYSLVGSFARFLIETRGAARFRTLYEMTPLKPLDREAGAPERWRDVYGAALGEIETEWKANLCAAAGLR